MKDITIIYKNDFGIAFWWKRCALENYKKINFVFNNMALHLTEVEVIIFAKHIETALNKLINNCCSNNLETLMFLETPAPQVSFTMGYEDLLLIQNLVEGALSELGLDSIIEDNWNNNLTSKHRI